MQIGDDSTYHMNGVGIIFIKMLDGTTRDKDVRYVPQMKKNIFTRNRRIPDHSVCWE